MANWGKKISKIKEPKKFKRKVKKLSKDIFKKCKSAALDGCISMSFHLYKGNIEKEIVEYLKEKGLNAKHSCGNIEVSWENEEIRRDV